MPDIGKSTAPFFEKLVDLVGHLIFAEGEPFITRLISDSTGFYMHVGILVVLSLLVAAVWALLDKHRENDAALLYALMVMVRYYLAMQLLMYGCSKIFKSQFYLPEPNTLFTTLGETPKDLLYWSLMGASRSYSIFMGSMEVMAAALLLFGRTKLMGALLSIFILVNVVAVNFSFDISVKLYACFLLLLAIVLVLPDVKMLYRFFMGGKAVRLQVWEPSRTSKWRLIFKIGKACVIGLLCIDAIAPYWTGKQFNDDAILRPPLHGAYEVTNFVHNGDTLPPLLTDVQRWKRVFIHRRGYFIVQHMRDSMYDHALAYDTIQQQLYLKQPETDVEDVLDYRRLNDSVLTLSGVYQQDTLRVTLKKIWLETLPLLQPGFHWTIDQ